MDFSGDGHTGTTLIAIRHQSCIVFAVDGLSTPNAGGVGEPGQKVRELRSGPSPLYCVLAGGVKTVEAAVDCVLNEHSKSKYSNGSRMTVKETAKCVAKLWSGESKYRNHDRRSVLVVGAYDGGQLELWAALNGIEGTEAKPIDEDVYFAGADSDAARPFFSTYTRETDLNTVRRWIEEGMVAASERPNSRTGGEIKILRILPNNQMETMRLVDVAILKQERDARLNLHH